MYSDKNFCKLSSFFLSIGLFGNLHFGLLPVLRFGEFVETFIDEVAGDVDVTFGFCFFLVTDWVDEFVVDSSSSSSLSSSPDASTNFWLRIFCIFTASRCTLCVATNAFFALSIIKYKSAVKSVIFAYSPFFNLFRICAMEIGFVMVK